METPETTLLMVEAACILEGTFPRGRLMPEGEYSFQSHNLQKILDELRQVLSNSQHYSLASDIQINNSARRCTFTDAKLRRHLSVIWSII